MELELRQLFRYARRWWWLLALTPLVAGLVAYLISSRQQPLYSANATLLIIPAQGSGGDGLNALRIGQVLASTYQQLVVTYPVLEPVVARLGLPYGADHLATKVDASTVRDTNLLRISVNDTDPERAALLANAVADEFQRFVSTQALETNTPSQEALRALIDEVAREIDQVRGRIDELEQGVAPTEGGRTEIERLRATLGDLERQYADLLVQARQLEFEGEISRSQVHVSVPARAPTAPYAPRTPFYTALGVLLGGVIGIGAVGLREYLDNTVKARDDFTELAGAPLLSVVGLVPRLRGRSGHEQLFVLEQPHSMPAEAVRLLRTNVEFAAAAREITTLAITSSGSSEGKSTITANLGIAMAQAGFSVVIVDADLRRPSQHKIFDQRNDRGLTTLLTRPDHPWRLVAQESLPGALWVVPSGPLPPNPADLLSLDRLRKLLAELAEAVDVVLIDTPPVLAVSDPLVVASNADAVVVVCRAGGTRIDALKRTLEVLRQGNARIAGIVLNQQSGRGGDDYTYYYDAGYYGSGPGGEEGERPAVAARRGGAGRTRNGCRRASRAGAWMRERTRLWQGANGVFARFKDLTGARLRGIMSVRDRRVAGPDGCTQRLRAARAQTDEISTAWTGGEHSALPLWRCRHPDSSIGRRGGSRPE